VRPTGIAAQQLNNTLGQLFDSSAPPAPVPVPAPAPVPAPLPVLNAVPEPAAFAPHYHPNGNGDLPVPFPASAETTPAPLPAQPWPQAPAPHKASTPVPAWRPPVVPTVVDSPFAISDEPLTNSPSLPQAPAPFTFLKSNGDHFAPAVEATPPPPDPLDDTLLPWMQPVRGRS
jgi:hypothetical protein